MYLSSSNVIVFPVAKNRRTVANGGRLFTEHYVSNLVRQLLDSEGFIIEDYSETSNSLEGDTKLRFNLYGYYFDITFNISSAIAEYQASVGTDWSGKRSLYAFIEIDSNNELQGQDESGLYKGLTIRVSDKEPSNVHYLKLFDINKSGSSIVCSLCNDSYLKFYPRSIGITEIDGKY